MQDDKTGLTEKYLVLRLQPDDLGDDAEFEIHDLTGEHFPTVIEGWHKRTWCFVLSPEKDDDYGAASRAAMAAYAEAIRSKNPRLADDIYYKLFDIEKAIQK